MKAKIEGSDEFKPFDLTITVESVEELKALWAAFNCNGATLTENAKNTNFGELPRTLDELWKLTNRKCEELGLLK